MEIIIDEYESGSEAPYWTYGKLVRRYWNQEDINDKCFIIETQQLAKAINNGFDCVEIKVKDIVADATLSHSFKKRHHDWQGKYIVQEKDGRIIAERATTSIMASVNAFGPQTLFKFRISIYKLLKLIAIKATVDADNGLQWSFRKSRLIYTLGKDEDGAIYLLILTGVPNHIPSGTVSGGVKIPGGQAE